MLEHDINPQTRRFVVVRRSSRLLQKLVLGKDSPKSDVSPLIDSATQNDTLKQIVMVRMFGYKLLIYKE